MGWCVACRKSLQGLRQGHRNGEFQAGVSLASSFLFQEEQMRQKASRAQFTSSMLRTVRTIKSHGWECAFLERLLYIRGRELGALKTSTLLFSVSLVSFQVSTFLVMSFWSQLQMPGGWERACLQYRAGASSIASSGLQRHLRGLCPLERGSRLSATLVLQQVALVVFAVHTLVAEDNAMDAEKAFVTLTVLSILNKAQAFLPFSVHCIVQVRFEEGQGVGELGPDSSAHPGHCQQRSGGKGLENSQTPSEVDQRVQGDLSQHPGECVTFTFRNSSWVSS